MEVRLTQGEQNLVLLQKTLPESEHLYLWAYSPEGELFGTTCPNKEMLEPAFRILGGMDKAMEYARRESRTPPILIGSPIGMQWAVTFEKERQQDILFVIGPVFYQPPVERELRWGLRPYTHDRENAAWASTLLGRLDKLTVMPYSVFTRYVMMVHNTLNLEQLGLDSLLSDPVPGDAEEMRPDAVRDRNKVYLAERAMLQMVRNGDINYHSALQGSILLSPGVPIRGADPLRQAKTSIIVFITLVSRAAMEGGLSPEVAYPLGDSYIQSVENCQDSGELSALASAMYHDFVYRVHHLRTNPNYSHAIQKCCDYIELSLDRKIRTADLAALVGYSEYYLTEKFKKETGQSVSSYTKFARVERAKAMLVSTDMTVQQIADRLAFSTPNYFIQCFRETTGYTPAQYRKKFLQPG